MNDQKNGGLKLPTLDVRISVPNDSDVDVLLVFQDSGGKVIPPRGVYATLVEKVKKRDYFNAKQGSCQFIRFGGRERSEDCMLVGLGKASELTDEIARLAGGNAWQKLVAEKSHRINVHLDYLTGIEDLNKGLSQSQFIRGFMEGMVLGCYQFNKYKSQPKSEGSSKDTNPFPTRISLVISDKNSKDHWDQSLKNIIVMTECLNITRNWSNEPSNIGTPEYYASESKNIAQQFGMKCRILTEKDADKEKMGLFLAVGAGAERESRLVVLEYVPKGVKNFKTIALVGKGVTFDSGGISIKPSLRMEEMKHDMTGAATVMGAITLAARLKVPHRVVAIMAFVENMPDGKAVQPGNVIRSRSGKTVEIINTDAEGRLILADALDFVHDFDPNVIVDVATLTGAVSIALGKYCCGAMGNDDSVILELQNAAKVHGEKIWQLPLYDEYFDDMKSEIADMKNSCNDPNGGTIRGAIFLKQFIRKGIKWAHLDIAATAWGLSHLTYFPKKGGSGNYVRSLYQFVADYK